MYLLSGQRTQPFRRVISDEFSQVKGNRPGEGRRHLHLECGHTKVQKASRPIPKETRCVRCLWQSEKESW